jgi:hypothetical protein
MGVVNQFATSTTELTSPSTDDLSNKTRRLPFISLREEPVEELRSQTSFAIPWLGLVALAISAITIIGSWLILHFINQRTVFTGKFSKPAVSLRTTELKVKCSSIVVMAISTTLYE